MGRSKLRGVEMAGVELAIEVPSNLEWQWPNMRLLALSRTPTDPDVHIGVRVARPQRPRGETYCYESRGTCFEVGWEGENWVVAVHGDEGCQRTARFDSDFRHGEVVVSPQYAADASYPLAHPLDELILLHRLTREGCVIVNGSVSVREGEALLFLDSSSGVRPEVSRGGSVGTRPSGHVVLRPVLEQRAACDTRVWVHSTPWRHDCVLAGRERVPLAAVHILSSLAGNRPVEQLSAAVAETEILQHVFAPIHDPDGANLLMEAVGRVVRRTSVSRLCKPQLGRETVLDWDRPRASLGFAPPSI